MCLFGCAVGSLFFFFNDTATTEIYTLSLHDALPISAPASGAPTACRPGLRRRRHRGRPARRRRRSPGRHARSEEHTSELQSRLHLVCRLLLEKKKKTNPSATLRTPLHTPTIRGPSRC